MTCPKILATKKARKQLVPQTTAALAKKKIEEQRQAAEETEDDKETEDEPQEKTLKRVKRTLANKDTSRPAPTPPKREPSGDFWQDARDEALAMIEAEERKKRS
jgi:hypothetical protein